MSTNKEIIFTLRVNHDAVQKALEEVENTPESKMIRDAKILFYLALLCSDTVSVPESQLERVIDFCKTQG